VALVYFDSSAFVKLLVEESGSELAAELWDAADAILSSRLAYPEVCAALAAAARAGRLGRTSERAAQRSWWTFWSAARPVELTAGVAQRAGELARRYGLGGADAVHLSSALALDDPTLVVVAWDERLRSGVTAAGFALAPASM
jgi:predicted nucleic acid-binding protein